MPASSSFGSKMNWIWFKGYNIKTMLYYLLSD